MLKFVCAGCGAVLSGRDAGMPFACPRAAAGGDVDHVVRPVDDNRCPLPSEGDANPFVRYRHLLSSYGRAKDLGIGDDAFVELVRRLDDGVARVDGRGFRATPFVPSRGLAERIGLSGGELWIKDETGNVSGSHKARHLAGIMLHLLLRRGDDGAFAGQARPPAPPDARPPAPPDSRPPAPPDAETPAPPDARTPVPPDAGTPAPRLAIASCGNAALAAAVVARAAEWPLEVFVPPSANPVVMERLAALSASIHVCEREGSAPGDPCYLAFRRAVAAGAVPFCCQGSDNGLTIEGGKTIAWEMVSSFRSRPAPQGGENRLDAIFVQVGGGALASAVAQGFANAVRAGALRQVPRFYAVQTTGAYPLKRAYDTLADRILARVPLVVEQGFAPAGDRERAELMLEHRDVVQEEIRFARSHRSLYMRPWEKPPRSIAHGILDDETYDWAEVVEGMLLSGGWPLVVSEERLMDANEAAREATGIDVDHTGSAGLAGLMKAIGIDERLATERVAVIFSGARRA